MTAVGLAPAVLQALGAGSDESRAATLQVFTGDRPPAADQPAVIGECWIDAQGLHFRPRFPFVSGLRYTARLRLPERAPLLRIFEVSPPAGPAPRVLYVFPSAEVWPENTLRLYIQFSQPMESRQAQRHVRLLDATGAVVSQAFVEIEHGLWDPRQTRLTLLFHPGRVKRGVGPGEHMGPPLVAGREYRLVVAADLRDAQGRALEPFERRFVAGPADRGQPTVAGFRLSLPNSPRSDLGVDLPEPLDEALLQRLMWVEDAAGTVLPGDIEVSRDETRWSYRPQEPWQLGAYALRVHPALEDRAGNRFDRLFDRAQPAHDGLRASAPAAEALRLPFAVTFTR